MALKTVFLSSTATDLAEYRDAAYRAIEGLDGYHCVRMEDFGARDWEADAFCRAKVVEYDVFVGIVGHLYGSCPAGSEQSYTEREYEAALAAQKPCLMFVAPEDFPLPACLREPEAQWRRQRAVRERVNRERIRDTFTSPDDLARRVVQAIRNWEEEQISTQHHPTSARTEGVWQAASVGLSAVLRNAKRDRAALEPQILPRIPRRVVCEKYLPAIYRGVNEGRQRIIPIIGPAGYGKSTILGDIYDQLTQAGTGWVALIRCDDLAFSSNLRGELATEMGKVVCDVTVPIDEVASALTAERGRGTLLIDTLDLALERAIVPALRHVFSQLIERDTTVVFTCRDYEYNAFLEPLHEKLAGLVESVDRYIVPEFTDEEVREAAQAFVKSNPDINPPDGGQAFADRILCLAADNRSLREITHNPLLLAMLCALFGKDGNVPQDLTVSRLYEQYWNKKIAESRRYGAGSPEAFAKEKLCLNIAKALFEMSGERLHESVYEVDLGPARPAEVATARTELLSDGVLAMLPNGRMHFFHQTFLEYTIARWLTTRSGEVQRNQLLDTLRETEAVYARLHWWPVIRQLLAIIDRDEFARITDRLDTGQLAAFRTVAFAAAARDEPLTLRGLLPLALARGSEYQKSLCFAVEPAPTPLADTVWEVVLTLLREGEKAAAIHAAQTAGALLARWRTSVGPHIDAALEAIAERTAKNDDSTDEYSEILGWLVKSCFPTLEQDVDLSVLRTLRQHYFLFGTSSHSAVLRLHLASRVPEEAQRELLMEIIDAPTAAKLTEELTTLLEKLLPSLVGSGETGLWASWSDALHTSLPEGWDVIQARAVGRRAAGDSALLAVILEALLWGDEKHIRRNFLAVCEAVRGGVGSVLAATLLATPIGSIPPNRFRAVGTLLKEIAAAGNRGCQEALARWIEPIVRNYPDELPAALAALADGSIFAQRVLVQLVKELAQQKQVEQIKKILRAAPEQLVATLASDIEQTLQTTGTDWKVQLTLVEFYRIQARASGEAILKLCEMSFGDSARVALAASNTLAILAGERERPSVADLLPLARSHIAGVRVACLHALTQIMEQGFPVTDHDLTKLCDSLAHENKSAVVQPLCELMAHWVRSYKSVPPTVAKAIDRIPMRLVDQGTFDGGIARSVLKALKAIAQLEDRTLIAQLGKWTRTLLSSININRIVHGEAEVIDLISAVARIDPQFLSVVVNDCPALSAPNVRAVAAAIRRVQGQTSPLLDYIIASDWCPSEVESMILKFRGV